VLYYSNAILSKTLPDLGPYVSLGITVVNAIMTFPPIVLIDVSVLYALKSSSLLNPRSVWAGGNSWLFQRLVLSFLFSL
jgi:hypothetical protein